MACSFLPKDPNVCGLWHNDLRNFLLLLTLSVTRTNSCRFDSCGASPQYCGDTPLWTSLSIPISREYVLHGSKKEPCRGFLTTRTRSSSRASKTVVTTLANNEVICGATISVLNLTKRSITSIATNGLDCLFTQTFNGTGTFGTTNSYAAQYITGIDFSNNFIENLAVIVNLGAQTLR